MVQINYNERSWAIDLISDINLWTKDKQVLIKRAGGESTLREGKKSLFPDVLIFGDEQSGKILQGWELKMPDTKIDNQELIDNATKKAKILGLNSFLVWNVSVAVLYKIENNESISVLHTWNDLNYIKTREEVLKNSKKIKKVLYGILEELNDFIQNGQIKTSSALDVLDSEDVSTLIHRNVGSYVSNLEEKIKQDTNLQNELNLWWRYAKNDYPDEKNKFFVLARNNLLYLINKFLLAHILKSYQAEASIVDQINHTVSLVDGLSIFRKLSKKLDFWNVFQTLPFENYITEEIWNDLINFNEFLKTLKFNAIKKELLHDLISHTIYRNKRKLAGQFTTPIKLADALVSFSMTNRQGHSFDPACGSGTIARSIYYKKKGQLGFKEALKTTWCSDKFALPLQLATFNMIDPEAMGEIIQVFREDATNIRIGAMIKFRDPFNGEIKERKVPKFSLIASNLPFVRQEDIRILNPNVENINNFIKEKTGLPDLILDGRTDLYGYLPFYFWSLLEDSGTLAIIVSNSWLGTKWGDTFYQILEKFYKIKAIITSGNGRWFDNTKVVTNLIILNKKRVNETHGEKTKFVILKKTINSYSKDEINELTALISLKEKLSEEDVEINSYTQNEIKKITNLGLNLNSLFADSRWLNDLSKYLISANELFNIARGERRGWDNMFYPESNSGIERDYLKPVLKTPRSIKKLLAEPDAEAFCCDKTIEELKEKGHNGAINWINRFKGLTNEKGKSLPEALIRANTNWYTMKSDTMGEIVTNINFGDRLFFAMFNEPTFVNQRLIRFTKKTEGLNTKLCHALLNSTLGLFYLEAMGTGRGEGALDLSKNKIEKDLKMINPNLYSQPQVKEILGKFKILENRKISSVEEELGFDDRNELDKAILEPLGLSGLRKYIKKSLKTLYKVRSSVNK